MNTFNNSSGLNRNHVYAALKLFVLVLLLSSCNSAPNTETAALDEAKNAIQKSNAIYFDSFKNNDPSIFIDRYAEDASILLPNAPQIYGKEGAADFFRKAYDEYGLRGGKFITTAVYGDGVKYVTEEGLWQSYNLKGELMDDGKFLVLWKKTDKGWKMFRDSFSSNRQAK
ncbi:YybH family protein [Flavobacterium sp. T12S277]|uniref:YybH family protein n=1 Tax=Flavobacterium sp. T12S277 TaxID=3402752 RepID=UPI003AE4B55C